jgi:transcriptional regulatory protein GAL4
LCLTSHLTKVEDRLRRLEQVTAELLPNVDIEALISKSGYSGRVNHDRRPKVSFAAASTAYPPVTKDDSEEEEDDSTDSEENQENAYHSSSETSSVRPRQPTDQVPEEADGFDWTEDELIGNDLSDGMAALSLITQGTGYFGVASSSGLLRALRVSPWDLVDSSLDTLAASEANPDKDSPSSQSSLNPLFDIVPVDNGLPARYVSSSLVDAYFQYYHVSYPFLHEETFRAQFNEMAPRPRPEVWDLLLSAVLALGAWCLGGESSTVDLLFYQNAKQTITSTIMETGSLQLVQALTLLSNYAQKRNKPNTGWNFLGLAVKMAIGLGLFKEFPGWKSSPLKQEMRRRAWWGLYMFDSGAAQTFGRPVNSLDIAMVDTKRVLNIEDEDLSTDSTELPKPRLTPTLYSGMIAQTELCTKTNAMYNKLITRPSPSAREVLEMDKQIAEFQENLPSYFKEEIPIDFHYDNFLVLTRFRLIWRYKNLRIMMFRPFILQRVLSEGDTPLRLLNGPNEKQCRRECLRNAHETILSVSDFVSNYSLSNLGVWYAVFFLFQACLIPLVCACSEPDSEHAGDWKMDIEATKAVLTGLSSENRLAARFLNVINRLIRQYMEYDEITQAPVTPKSELMSDIYSLFFDGFMDVQRENTVPMDLNFWEPPDI